jgi:hypothetical protein
VIARGLVVLALAGCSTDRAPVDPPWSDVTWGDAALTFAGAWAGVRERCFDDTPDVFALQDQLCADFTPPCDETFPFVGMLGKCTVAMSTVECGVGLPQECRMWIGALP